jgi:uncharacterized membrane protein
MTLPDITAYIPKVELPFDVPVLLHPLVVHFMIAIPVIVLLLELINLIAKKKAIGVVSFVLLFLTAVAAVGAYFTGITDGKESFVILSEAGKAELSEHNLIGVYLLFGSLLVIVLNLLSEAICSAIMKSLYLIALIGFVLGIFEQGKDGGELVYEHGMNVAKVKALDDKIFELEEALEEAQEQMGKSTQKEEAPVVLQETAEVVKEKTPEETTPVETLGDAVPEPQQTVEEVNSEVKEESLPFTEPVQVEQMPQAMEQVKIPTH